MRATAIDWCRAEGVPTACAGAGRAEVLRFDPPQELRFARGDTLFFEGDTADFYFEIASGMVRCCRLTPEGRRLILRFAGRGRFIGLAAGARYGYSAEALTEVVVCRRRAEGLDAAAAAGGAFALRLMRALREELAAAEEHVMRLGRLGAGARVAAFLLALAEDEAATPGRSGPDAPGFVADSLELPMTRLDIADHLGLTIETVSRKLNELRTLGILHLETPTWVRILDRARLKAIAAA